MDSTQLKKIVEGALLAADKPLTVDHLMSLFGLENTQPTREEIRAAVDAIIVDCEERGFELKQVASGYRFQVRQELSPWIGRLWEERPQKYSRALLETLAIIAYRQPMTRGEIEEIRGVSVSTNITKTLLEREWVRVVGHRDVPGKPALYATTKQFLDYFNLKRLDELPTLNDIRDIAELAPELALSDEGAEDSSSVGDQSAELEDMDGTELSDADDAEGAGEDVAIIDTDSEELDETFSDSTVAFPEEKTG